MTTRVMLVLATLMVVIVVVVPVEEAIMVLVALVVMQVSVQHSVLMFGLGMGTAIQYVIIRIAAMIMAIVTVLVSG